MLGVNTKQNSGLLFLVNRNSTAGVKNNNNASVTVPLYFAQKNNDQLLTSIHSQRTQQTENADTTNEDIESEVQMTEEKMSPEEMKKQQKIQKEKNKKNQYFTKVIIEACEASKEAAIINKMLSNNFNYIGFVLGDNIHTNIVFIGDLRASFLSQKYKDANEVKQAADDIKQKFEIKRAEIQIYLNRMRKTLKLDQSIIKAQKDPQKKNLIDNIDLNKITKELLKQPELHELQDTKDNSNNQDEVDSNSNDNQTGDAASIETDNTQTVAQANSFVDGVVTSPIDTSQMNFANNTKDSTGMTSQIDMQNNNSVGEKTNVTNQDKTSQIDNEEKEEEQDEEDDSKEEELVKNSVQDDKILTDLDIVLEYLENSDKHKDDFKNCDLIRQDADEDKKKRKIYE